MTRTLLAVLLFIFCAVLPAQATWLDSNWTKRVKVTIDADKVNGDLANFPVFVDLNGMPASFFTTIKDNGADLRVTKTDGSSEVPFELVYLDTNNGAGELHFQANGTLSGTTNSDWYLYYGYNGASAYARDDTYGSENVWTQGYVAVYHMNEDPNGDVAGAIKDSTSNVNHGTPNGTMTSDDLALGRVGQAIDFDGGDDYIDLGTNLSSAFSEITISTWLNHPSSSWQALIERTAWDNNDGFALFMGSGGSVAHWGHFPDYTSSISNVQNSIWHHVVGTMASDMEYKIYVGGDLESIRSGSRLITSAVDGPDIARRPGGSYYYSGLIDELKISGVARSAEWIWTEYQNQNSPDTFYTIGSEEENTVPVTNGLVAWWDASDLSTLVTDSNGQVSEWIDKSGNGNNGTQADPTYQPYSGIETINSLNVLSSNGGQMAFTMSENITNIRTMFFVMRNDNSSYGGYIDPINSYTAYITLTAFGGQVQLNSSEVDSRTTEKPLDETFLLSFVTTGNISADRLAYTAWGTRWSGEFAEVLLYNGVLADSELNQVEEYLSDKWGLDTSLNLDSVYPYDNGSYFHASEKLLKLEFSNDVELSTGNLDLYYANGTLFESIDLKGPQVSGNGSSILDISLSSNLDTSTSYYVNLDAGSITDVFSNTFPGINGDSAWNFTTKASEGFDMNGLLAHWDASELSSLTIDANGRVSRWRNLTSYGDKYDALQGNSSYQPYTGIETINSLNVLSSNGGQMAFTMSENITNIRTMFFVMRNDNSSYGGYIDPINSYTTYITHTAFGGQVQLNSSEVDSRTTEKPLDETFLLSFVTTGNISADRLAYTTWGTRWSGEFAEVLLYDKGLSEEELYSVESYLANKWGFGLNHSSLSPVDGSSGFLPSRDLTMTFPQAVDIMNGNLSIFEANGDLFETIDVNSGQVTGNGTTTITFNPSSDLAPFSDYYVQIQGGAFTDAANGSTAFTGIYNSTEWNFTTGRAFDPSGFSNSNKITILHSQVNGDVNNFPVYIDLGHMPNSFFSVVKADGSDIRVTNSAQDEELPFELVSIDKSAKTGELWFRADSLSSTSNSDFYLWYGNGDASAYSADHLYGSENVWSQGYVAVYHMNEDPNGDVADAIKDSTSYANHGTPSGSMTSDDLVDGQVGKAIDFDRNNDEISNTSFLTQAQNYDKGSYSVWLYNEGAYGDGKVYAPIGLGRSNDTKVSDFGPGIDMRFNPGRINNTYRVNGTMLFDSRIGGTHTSPNQWHFYTVNQNGNTISIYHNGEMLNSYSSTVWLDDNLSSPTPATVFTIGSSYYNISNPARWLGLIDDVKFTNESRSVDWIKTEYNNQSSAETFYLIDDQVPGTETSKPMFMMGGY